MLAIGGALVPIAGDETEFIEALLIIGGGACVDDPLSALWRAGAGDGPGSLPGPRIPAN